ncbi:MAG: flagellar biosynthetic protein FliR [Syntrophobacterales bacterium]|nr:flagellar biosynthetic protein FliR [Syntrophobacterales bacterium]
MDVLLSSWQHFLLVTLRTSCLLVFWPVWDHRLLPLPVKAASLLALSFCLTPVVAPHLPPWPASLTGLLLLVAREALLGFSLGLTLRFLLSGVQMAGNLVSLQMGFGMITLIDPQSPAQNTVLGDLLFKLAVLLFLVGDGPHVLLRLLVRSFSEVPLAAGLDLPGGLLPWLAGLGRWMWQVTVKLAAPLMALFFLVQVALGLVSRAVPQVQVMLLSFPLTIALGLFTLSLLLTFLGPFLTGQFRALELPLAQGLRAFAG